MRVLVIYAHPVAESYNGALHKMTIETLKAAGHEVDDCDLYAEDFQPVMSRQERLDYHDTAVNTKLVQVYVDRLRAADALVFCFPTWSYGPPAILKGFFDRVFGVDVAFKLLQEGGVVPGLTNIRKVAAVVTYGRDRLRATFVMDPPRAAIKRYVGWCVGRGTPVKYMAHYNMNVSTDKSRARFMNKVRKYMETF